MNEFQNLRNLWLHLRSHFQNRIGQAKTAVDNTAVFYLTFYFEVVAFDPEAETCRFGLHKYLMNNNSSSQVRFGGASSASTNPNNDQSSMAPIPEWMKAGYWRGKAQAVAAELLEDERAIHNERVEA